MFVWEKDLEEELLVIINSTVITEGAKDGWSWGLDRSGCYTTKSTYRNLERKQEQHQEATGVEVLKMLWKCKIPSKELAFTWQLFKGRIPTKVNLLRSGITIPNEEQCCVF